MCCFVQPDIVQISMWKSATQMSQLFQLQNLLLPTTTTKSASMSWLERLYVLLKDIITRFIPDQIRMICFILWWVDLGWLPEAHTTALSLIHFNRTGERNSMKSTSIHFTPSTSPTHLNITTGCFQSLQCRKRVAVSTKSSLADAPFISLVSSTPPWSPRLPGIFAWVPGSPPPLLPFVLAGLFLTLYSLPSQSSNILPFLT